MDVETLKKRLCEIETITNQEWMNSLNDRKREELKFHDADRDTSRIATLDEDTYEKIYGNRKYYQSSKLSEIYRDN